MTAARRGTLAWLTYELRERGIRTQDAIVRRFMQDTTRHSIEKELGSPGADSADCIGWKLRGRGRIRDACRWLDGYGL